MAIALEERLKDGATSAFDFVALRGAAGAHVEWLGALFAATYIGYYSRFSSQWAYLAGLYNQIMAAQVQTPPGVDPASDRIYAAWWAAFIEDAEDVHLALKPSYAAAIAHCLGDPSVRARYEGATAKGKARLTELEERLERCLGTPMFKALREDGRRVASLTAARAAVRPRRRRGR